MPALVLAVFLAFWGLLEQKSSVLKPFLCSSRCSRRDPRGPRGSDFRSGRSPLPVFLIEIYITLFLVLLVGPDLISQDLRYNAMPLVLLAAVRRLDYFVGKLGVIVGFLALVAVLPALAAYLLGVVFSLDLGVVRDTWRVLAGRCCMAWSWRWCAGW